VNWLSPIGLTLNFAGTLMMAFSFGKNLAEAHQVVKGRKVYLASFLYPHLFRAGIGILSAGFFIQAVAEIARLLKS
jgi:hypothetical protein